MLRAWPNGTDRVLTEGWDRSPGELTWSPDGKEIFATADDIYQPSSQNLEFKCDLLAVVAEFTDPMNPNTLVNEAAELLLPRVLDDATH